MFADYSNVMANIEKQVSLDVEQALRGGGKKETWMGGARKSCAPAPINLVPNFGQLGLLFPWTAVHQRASALLRATT
jgi:hypothetical protein